MKEKHEAEPEETPMDAPVPVRAMRDRVYENIPVDEIVVVNSRSRDSKQFADNVRSIESVGLYKPIIVNRRALENTGKYELVCGEGRLLAHKELGLATIRAEVVDLPEMTAQLMTLSENIARNQPPTIEFARALRQMRDDGMTGSELARISGRCESNIYRLLLLLDKGEDRLVKGVEDGLISLDFAIIVADSDNRSIQHLLIDAYDAGLVNANNVATVRTLIEDRKRETQSDAATEGKPPPKEWTVGQLKKEITSVIDQKERYVHQANIRMNRVMGLLAMLRDLASRPEFVDLAQKAGLDQLPRLNGEYGA
jgi:ParB family chromosome partitioning protein